MRRKIFIYSTLSLLGIVFALGASNVSAMGFGMFGGFGSANTEVMAAHMQTAFQNMADTFGISVDEAKNAWAQGKTIDDIAKEKGLTQEQLQQKLIDARTQQMKAQMQTLVDKGIITQAQADQRLQLMQNRTTAGQGRRGGFGHMQNMGMGRFGF